eukprot:COSAG06_NODE_4901_length_3872_cov_6065.039491_3_plen_109_part_00
MIERERDEAKAAAVRALEAEAQEEAARRREEEEAVEAQKVQAKADEDAVWHQQQASWKQPMYASYTSGQPACLVHLACLFYRVRQRHPLTAGWLGWLRTGPFSEPRRR